MRTMQRRSGYSLIELMIAISILFVILAGVFYSFGVQNEKYVVVADVTDAQQSLRGVAEMIERDVRRAGYMVPAATAACAHDYTNQPDVVILSNSEAIRPIDALKLDAPELLVGDLGIDVISMSATTVRVIGGGVPKLKIDDGANGALATGGGVILVDRNDPEQRVACGEITAIVGDTLTVDFGPSPDATSIGADDVIAIPAVVYKIVPATAAVPSQLLRNGLVLAYDVEDLQASFFFDADANGNQTAANELFGTLNAAGTYPPASGATFDMGSLREVAVQIVTVTHDDAPNASGGSPTLTQGLVVSNRDSNLAPADRRVRRLHTANVRLRNLG
jgi:prepilin-type N-terminal cleavage/methylation domain-containing protein